MENYAYLHKQSVAHVVRVVRPHAATNELLEMTQNVSSRGLLSTVKRTHTRCFACFTPPLGARRVGPAVLINSEKEKGRNAFVVAEMVISKLQGSPYKNFSRCRPQRPAIDELNMISFE